MALLPSLQLLEELLTGRQLSVIELDELVNSKVKEDLYIDYKHGELLKEKDVSKTVREYMSAFANSAGGILIIGVNESGGIPNEVTGCNGHGKGNLDEWASRCLTPIAYHFAPQPRFQVIKHSKGEVLVCVVQRSLNLVPLTENGGIVYYFRLHDQTLRAPDYLMADILLGRRQQPIFEIEEIKALNFRRIVDNAGCMDLSFEIGFRVGNANVVWADDSKWGVVFWSHNKTSNFGVESGRPGQYLLSYLEVNSETFTHPNPKHLLHNRGPAPISKPFDVGGVVISFVVPLRVQNSWFSYVWKAALYFVSRNSLPVWYQLEFVVNANTVQLLVDEQKELVSPHDFFCVRKLSTERPVIAWEEIKK
ncbi:MAG: ATP-binding protein [Chloroflexota bacterium]